MTEAVFKVRVTVEPDSEPATEDWDGEGLAGAVVKSEDERRYTLTVAYPANKPDVGVARDGYRDFAKEGDVEECAWDYMRKSRNIGLWHEDGTDGAGELVESYVYRGPDWPVGETVVKAGDWLVGVVWDTPSWDLIKAGKINGVSMQGKATRTDADPDSLEQLRDS